MQMPPLMQAAGRANGASLSCRQADEKERTAMLKIIGAVTGRVGLHFMLRALRCP
jgi:hypothetical protein